MVRARPRPRPGHKHPSINCYKNHRCRCDGCVAVWNEYQQSHRRKQPPVPTTRPILTDEEVARLRRLLGLE